MPDTQDTADYKLNKSGKKVRAHKIVFNKGEEEPMRKQDVVNEVLDKDDPASKWIADFVKSDNPKFEGKSKKKRINMALGAYYAAKRGAVKEEVESVAEMIDRVREYALLDEAVEVSHDRYMRSHGKKASGGTGTWMFTHKPMGSVDYKDESQVHSARGSFSDAKKSAQQWAKKNGHSRVYVMEEVELEENKTQHPYHAGYDAHGQKKTRQHNPYKEGSEGAAQWAKGWEHASDGKPRVKMSNEEVDLNESLAVHGKYTIRTGPVVRDIPEHNPEHVAAHNTRLRQLGVVADAEPGGGNYGSTHRVTVTNNETNEKTHHHVYQSDVSGNKAIMSVRGVGQKNVLHGEHNKVIKDYLSGKKATSKPVHEEVEGVTEGRFVKAAGGVPSDRYGNPKEPTPPKSSATASLNQLLKNKRENPGQSPFKTQDDKVKKYLGMYEELELDEAPYTGKGNHRPGWMLRADPELAAKFKKNIDAAKLRQKYMGKTADEIAKMKKG